MTNGKKSVHNCEVSMLYNTQTTPVRKWFMTVFIYMYVKGWRKNNLKLKIENWRWKQKIEDVLVCLGQFAEILPVVWTHPYKFIYPQLHTFSVLHFLKMTHIIDIVYRIWVDRMMLIRLVSDTFLALSVEYFCLLLSSFVRHVSPARCPLVMFWNNIGEGQWICANF